MTALRHSAWMTLFALFCIFLASCTIIRDSNNGDNGDNGDNGFEINDELPPFDDIPADADVIDALVFVELTNGHSMYSSRYYAYLSEVQIALAVRHGIFVRDLAVAPLYRQHSHRPPLLFGRNDPNNLRPDLEQSLEYYLSEDGRGHLDDRVDAPSENPAALGMELDREPVYNPETGSGDGSPYFREPEDGFAVFYITGTARECGHDDGDCAVNGQPPADYFTATDSDGAADWLNLPGDGLAPEQIAHVAITTDEGVDYDTFRDACLSRPDFPTRYLDFLEPSEHNSFFQPFTQQIDSGAGVARQVDMCEALSSGLDGSALRTANDIARVIR